VKIDHETHYEALTEMDIAANQPNKQILHYLDKFVMNNGKEKRDIRVLDFGCGRGVLHVTLKRLGFDAYGADVDVHAITVARDFLRNAGYDVNSVGTINVDGKTTFPDAYFDVIVSDQVIEHVEDINLVATECARLTKTGGWGLHSYPAHLIPVEPHVFVPFVHWLPKKSIRRYWIFFCLFFKKETPFDHLKHMNKMQLAQHYFGYLNEQTFYRSWPVVSAAFQNQGFSSRQVVINHPKVTSHKILGKLLVFRPFAWILNRMLALFVQSDLLVVKL
jgi:SAM-dependent methyltransferase